MTKEQEDKITELAKIEYHARAELSTASTLNTLAGAEGEKQAVAYALAKARAYRADRELIHAIHEASL